MEGVRDPYPIPPPASPGIVIVVSFNTNAKPSAPFKSLVPKNRQKVPSKGSVKSNSLLL